MLQDVAFEVQKPVLEKWGFEACLGLQLQGLEVGVKQGFKGYSTVSRGCRGDLRVSRGIIPI